MAVAPKNKAVSPAKYLSHELAFLKEVGILDSRIQIEPFLSLPTSEAENIVAQV